MVAQLYIPINNGEVAPNRMGENICKLCNWWSNNIQNLERVQKLNNKNQYSSETAKGQDQAFFKERNSNGKQRMKKCLGLLAIRKMQVETKMRFYLTPVRTATYRKQKRINFGNYMGKMVPYSTVGGKVLSFIHIVWLNLTRIL